MTFLSFLVNINESHPQSISFDCFLPRGRFGVPSRGWGGGDHFCSILGTLYIYINYNLYMVFRIYAFIISIFIYLFIILLLLSYWFLVLTPPTPPPNTTHPQIIICRYSNFPCLRSVHASTSTRRPSSRRRLAHIQRRDRNALFGAFNSLSLKQM